MSARERRQRIEAGRRQLVRRLDGLAPGFRHDALDLNMLAALDCWRRQFPGLGFNELAARLPQAESDRLMAAYGRLLSIRIADGLSRAS